MSIPVIDLFAGPGGLGEGFSGVKLSDGTPAFDIKLSIEKDTDAHKTLIWRSFYRQFIKKGDPIPKEYYEAIRINNLKKREKRIEEILEAFPEGEEAKAEARLIELGSEEWPDTKVDNLIKERLGENIDNWVLIGGPPCQAYSNVGRSRVGGIDPEDHRVYLYREYLRFIIEYKPAVFVMENVSGLLSAKVNEEKIFDWILSDLECDGEYSIHSLAREVEKNKDYLIKSENYGIPQKRHRVILLGLRSDIRHHGKYLKKVNKPVSLETVIGNLPQLRSGINREFLHYHPEKKYKNGQPKRIYNNLIDSDDHWIKLIENSIRKIKEWGELNLNGIEKSQLQFKNGTGGEFILSSNLSINNKELNDWIVDKNLNGVPNHQSRSHLSQDLMRYLFASLYVQDHGKFPRLNDFGKHNEELLPDHANAKSGKFTDRFRVQLPNKPATTITSHISKDGHYFIHYHPEQCRTLTVREAARIQTFPDNYLFRGSRTEQYKQVGNAVPPLLAKKIAKIVSKLF